MFLKKLFILSCMLGSFSGPVGASTIYIGQSSIGTELKIPVHQWSNPQQSPKAIIVAIEGLVFDGKAYDALARHLCDNGYAIYSTDMRGFGDWTRNKGQFDGDNAIHFTKSKEDLTNLLSLLRKRFPDKQIICLGESFGANYAIWEASTEPKLLDGAIASGISYKVRVHPTARWAVTIARGLAHPKTPLNLEPYLRPTLSNNKELTQVVLADPQTVTKMSATDLVKAALTNKIAVQEIDKIPESMPILIMAGSNDQIQKTTKIPEMIARMGSKQTRLVVFKDKGHLLLEHQSVDPEVAQTIDTWLDNHTRGTVTTSKEATKAISSK